MEHNDNANIELICTDDIGSKEELSQSLSDWTKLVDLINEYKDVLKDLNQKVLDLKKKNVDFKKLYEGIDEMFEKLIFSVDGKRLMLEQPV